MTCHDGGLLEDLAAGVGAEEEEDVEGAVEVDLGVVDEPDRGVVLYSLT